VSPPPHSVLAVLFREAGCLVRAVLVRYSSVMPSAPARFSCLDDDHGIGSRAVHQEFLSNYYPALIMLPISAAISIGCCGLLAANTRIPAWVVYGLLVWGFGLMAYHFILTWTLRCPNCGWRFGMESSCTTCALPRHKKCDLDLSSL
jgi:hypothetical protein